MFPTKKTLIWIALITSISLWTTFWYLEEKLYCDVKSNIVVSLTQKDGGKCEEYITYLEQRMKKTYKDILVIQWYIKRKQDLGYWKPLKEEKLELLNSMQKLRLNILISMRIFEWNLLKKSQELFITKTRSEKRDMEISLGRIENADQFVNSQIKKYAELVKSALSAIENANNAKSFEKFSEAVVRYLYLRKEIEWK